MLSVSGEDKEVKRSTDGKVGVSKGEMNGEGVVGGEANLDNGESGTKEPGSSWLRPYWHEGPPFHTTVSGVLLRLFTLPL